MNHRDHVALIRDGVASDGVWVDLGSGDGAFFTHDLTLPPLDVILMAN